MQHAVRILPEHRFDLGEGAIWDDRAQALYWVDIKAPALHRLVPETGEFSTWAWSEPVSCCGLSTGSEILVAGRSGLWAFDPDAGAAPRLAYPIDPLPQNMRTNDGKVGPDGAFWVSTMLDVSDRGPVGVVLRITSDGQVTQMLDGLTTANGMEWSPDGRTFYLADTRLLWVDQWSFDLATGDLSDRRRFVSLDEGKPDGAAVDATGGYWVAGIYAGKVHCYGPDGVRRTSVQVPAEMVTMPCFGGADMKTLYITSLSRGSDGVPGDGGLYAAQVDVAGPSPRRMALS